MNVESVVFSWRGDLADEEVTDLTPLTVGIRRQAGGTASALIAWAGSPPAMPMDLLSGSPTSRGTGATTPSFLIQRCALTINGEASEPSWSDLRHNTQPMLVVNGWRSTSRTLATRSLLLRGMRIPANKSRTAPSDRSLLNPTSRPLYD